MYDKCYFCLDQLPKLKKESTGSFFVNFGRSRGTKEPTYITVDVFSQCKAITEVCEFMNLSMTFLLTPTPPWTPPLPLDGWRDKACGDVRPPNRFEGPLTHLRRRWLLSPALSPCVLSSTSFVLLTKFDSIMLAFIILPSDLYVTIVFGLNLSILTLLFLFLVNFLEREKNVIHVPLMIRLHCY